MPTSNSVKFGGHGEKEKRNGLGIWNGHEQRPPAARLHKGEKLGRSRAALRKKSDRLNGVFRANREGV